MHKPRNARLAWTFFAGIAAVGLFGTAALAGGPSGAPTLPGQANSRASSTHSPSETDSSEASDSEAPTSTPVGPDATGPAAFGLCNAYKHAKVHGKSVGHSIAFRNLAAAAGGVDKIDAYCATIPHPGSAATSSPSAGPPSHPSGPPSGVPSHSNPAGH